MASKPLPVKDRLLRSVSTRPCQQSTLNTTRPTNYKNWTAGRLVLACNAVKEGLPLRRAAEEYEIPRSTLQDHVSGRVLLGSRSGHQYLSDTEENEVEEFLLESAKMGFPRTRKEVMSLVQNILHQKGLPVTVSSGWWSSFIKRHPALSVRVAEELGKARHQFSQSDSLNYYFDLLEQTIEDNELSPAQIFNCDETGIPLNASVSKVVVKKGAKHSRSVTSGNKSQITVLAACNAAGFVLPPFVVFDRKALKPELCEGEVSGTMYGLSDSGWINSELFELWFMHHFLPHAPAARPLLLLLDGHSSHYNPAVIRKAAEEKIIIFCLPPHSSHETQPLDKGPFGPFKCRWKEVCHKFIFICDNPGKVVTRFTFSKLFNEAWTKAMTISNISAGFQCTGIYPLNRSVLIPSEPEVQSLADRTGVNFIPLYSLSRQRRSLGMAAKVHVDQHQFSEEEEERFRRRYEEKWDIENDERYNQWKLLQHPSPDVNNDDSDGDYGSTSSPLNNSTAQLDPGLVDAQNYPGPVDAQHYPGPVDAQHYPGPVHTRCYPGPVDA